MQRLRGNFSISLRQRLDGARFYRLEKKHSVTNSAQKRNNAEPVNFIDAQTAEKLILEYKNDYTNAINVYKQLVNDNSFSAPNSNIIKSLVQTCITHNDQKQFTQVLKLWDDVARFNINLDTNTLESISLACVRSSYPESVSLSMYQELQPEQETYPLLLNLMIANAKNDRAEIAFQIFKKIIAKGWKLANGGVTSLIHLGVRKEMLEQCLEVFDHAKRERIELSNPPRSEER